MARARSLLALHHRLEQSFITCDELAAVVHASLTLGLDALNRYMQDRLGGELVSTCSAAPSALPARARALNVDLGVVLRATVSGNVPAALIEIIRGSVTNQCFEGAERIGEGLRYLRNGSFWAFAALGLGEREEELQDRLNRTVQAGLASGSKGAVTRQDVEESLLYLGKIVECIEEYLRTVSR